MGFTNRFYGASGRHGNNAQYNTVSVQNSAAGAALSKYGGVSQARYTEIRQQASIDSLCETVVGNQTSSIEPCDNRFCLFNIVNDPCETKDLSHVHQDILRQLLSELEDYNKTVVPAPRELLKLDPKAHPKYWHNYWTRWLDEQDSNASSRVYLTTIVTQIVTALVTSTINCCLHRPA